MSEEEDKQDKKAETEIKPQELSTHDANLMQTGLDRKSTLKKAQAQQQEDAAPNELGRALSHVYRAK